MTDPQARRRRLFRWPLTWPFYRVEKFDYPNGGKAIRITGRAWWLFVRTVYRSAVMAAWRPFLEPRRRAESPRKLWRLARLYERTRP